MNVKIGKDMLKECKEITFLGVIIDNMLRFDSHFNKVLGKIKNKQPLNGKKSAKLRSKAEYIPCPDTLTVKLLCHGMDL